MSEKLTGCDNGQSRLLSNQSYQTPSGLASAYRDLVVDMVQGAPVVEGYTVVMLRTRMRVFPCATLGFGCEGVWCALDSRFLSSRLLPYPFASGASAYGNPVQTATTIHPPFTSLSPRWTTYILRNARAGTAM